ncbi:MAG: hypothetical protein K0R13_2668 [Propionibacteriaceae bacterium]|nr:hypothetical protein [Propionibacteriaceae bacterium]
MAPIHAAGEEAHDHEPVVGEGVDGNGDQAVITTIRLITLFLITT